MSNRTESGMRVYLLGPMHVEVDGTALDVRTWKSKRAVTLFKYLVARGGERVPRDVLVDLLWPDSEDGDKSTHNLHTVIYYLRRTLEPHLGRYEEPRFLRHAHGLYWINMDAPVWADTQEFSGLIRKAEVLRDQDDEHALVLYRRALELYRDDFCSEDLYDDWAVNVRERFRELYFGATLQAANLMVTIEHNFSEAVNLCRTALAREPYREELHQAIIGHLIKAGRYGEAAQQFRTCQRLLNEEFGLSPSPETQALFETMKHLQTEAPMTRGQETAEAVDYVDDESIGPFVCDRQTYNAIYRLELRRQRRSRQPIGLLRVLLGDEDTVGPAERRHVERCLALLVRQGDVVCWESPGRFVLQLPGADEDAVILIRERLRTALEKIGFIFVSMDESVIYPDDVDTFGSSISSTTVHTSS